jgi:holin-like protein
MSPSPPAAALSLRVTFLRRLAVSFTATLQIAALWAFNVACGYAATALHSPVPGSVIGFVLLFLLLSTKVVRPQWIERGGSLLGKHLSLFIVPITVGIMALGPLLAQLGWGLLVALFLSAAVGLAFSGAFAQALAGRRELGA